MPKTLLIFGASSGLGLYLLNNLPTTGDTVYSVSRSKPTIDNKDYQHQHISADLSEINAVDKVTSSLGDKAIDLFIYCSGSWEMTAIAKISPSEIQSIINVNLSSFMANIVGLMDNLHKAKGKVIAIGSTSGLDNAIGGGPIYAASKFGLRGAIHGFRPLLSELDVACSIINVAGFNPSDDEDNGRIDPREILNVIRMIATSGTSACLKEIDLTTLAHGENGV